MSPSALSALEDTVAVARFLFGGSGAEGREDGALLKWAHDNSCERIAARVGVLRPSEHHVLRRTKTRSVSPCWRPRAMPQLDTYAKWCRLGLL